MASQKGPLPVHSERSGAPRQPAAPGRHLVAVAGTVRRGASRPSPGPAQHWWGQAFLNSQASPPSKGPVSPLRAPREGTSTTDEPAAPCQEDSTKREVDTDDCTALLSPPLNHSLQNGEMGKLTKMKNIYTIYLSTVLSPSGAFLYLLKQALLINAPMRRV